MLLMVENGIRGEICQAIYRYVKANNNYMNNYDKRKTTYLMYLDPNNLHEWAMSQKLPMNGFERVEDLSQFNENFIKNYEENSVQDIFLKQMQSIQMNYLFNLHKHLPFLPERKKVFYLHEDLSSLLKRKKLEGVKKLVCGIEDKEKYFIHRSALKQPCFKTRKCAQSNSI